MRRLIIAALSALILLCVPFSTPQGRGLHSIRWTPLIINLLIRAGAPAATSLRPGRRLRKRPLVNAARRKALRRVFRWNPVSPSNESSPAVNRIPTRSR